MGENVPTASSALSGVRRSPGRPPTRSSRRRPIVVVLASTIVLAAVQAVGPIASTAAPTRPNIVLIVTDDMRWDEMQRMPTVQAELVRGPGSRRGSS